jgi:hypothetical protein
MDCAINIDELDCLSTKTYLFGDTKQNSLPDQNGFYYQ